MYTRTPTHTHTHTHKDTHTYTYATAQKLKGLFVDSGFDRLQKKQSVVSCTYSYVHTHIHTHVHKCNSSKAEGAVC